MSELACHGVEKLRGTLH